MYDIDNADVHSQHSKLAIYGWGRGGGNSKTFLYEHNGFHIAGIEGVHVIYYL